MEINNARNFVDWSRRAQPWMVLHELAHGYYFRTLGDDDAGVEEAYRRAIDGKLYDSVEYFDRHEAEGRTPPPTRRSISRNSPRRTSARTTSTPSPATSSRRHDPAGYRLMERAWGRPREGNSGEK